MTRPPVDQWLAGARDGDAITTYAQALGEMLRSWGHPSDIYSDYRHVGPEARRYCRDVRHYPERPAPGAVVLYHFSIGSDLTERFLALPPGVTPIVIYHNITPARYFRALIPESVPALEEGRRQLAALGPRLTFGIGDSLYNCRELEEAGCPETVVVPLIWKRPDILYTPDADVLGAFGGRAVNWLFVGRTVPNKRIDDIIRAFYYYRHHVNPLSRLFVVGPIISRYVIYLRALAAQLDLREVIFTGLVSPEKLAAYYRLAHVFLCMSEHEGFCMPLLEAMYFDVPVLAYDAAAVGDTLGDGGLLFSHKNFPEIAELAHLAAADPGFRDTLIRAGRRRLKEFSTRRVEEAFHRALERVMGSRLGPLPTPPPEPGAGSPGSKSALS